MALAWSILKEFTDSWLRICAYKKQQGVTANRASLIVLKAVPHEMIFAQVMSEKSQVIAQDKSVPKSLWLHKKGSFVEFL